MLATGRTYVMGRDCATVRANQCSLIAPEPTPFRSSYVVV